MSTVNIGIIDRLLRLALGVVFVVLALLTDGVFAVVFFILAAWALITGVMGFCMIYRFLGISTNKK